MGGIWVKNADWQSIGWINKKSFREGQPEQVRIYE
jgi:hypothetical protein